MPGCILIAPNTQVLKCVFVVHATIALSHPIVPGCLVFWPCATSYSIHNLNGHLGGRNSSSSSDFSFVISEVFKILKSFTVKFLGRLLSTLCIYIGDAGHREFNINCLSFYCYLLSNILAAVMPLLSSYSFVIGVDFKQPIIILRTSLRVWGYIYFFGIGERWCCLTRLKFVSFQRSFTRNTRQEDL